MSILGKWRLKFAHRPTELLAVFSRFQNSMNLARNDFFHMVKSIRQLGLSFIINNIKIDVYHPQRLAPLRGPGGSSTWQKSKSSFLLFLKKEKRGVSANRCFLLDQKILFLAEVIKFLNLEYIWVIKRVYLEMDIFGI